MKSLNFLIMVLVLTTTFLLACTGSRVTPLPTSGSTPAQTPTMVVPSPTPDIGATVQAAVETTMAQIPTAEPVPTPDIEAEVGAAVEAALARIPTPDIGATVQAAVRDAQPAQTPISMPHPTSPPLPATATPVRVQPTGIPTPTNGLDDGLLVWYDFEGDFLTSGRVIDRSGNGHHAQVIGNVRTSSAVSGGNTIFFSGDGYIQANSNPVAGLRQVTFSFWFKTENPRANYKLASAAWWRGGPGSGWILATHIPEFWSDDTRGLSLPGLTNVENNFRANEWVHEVVTYDGERLKEYTNGRLVNDWPTTGAPLGSGEPMAVGAWPPLSGFNFRGAIDEFQIFGRALSSEEVKALYNSR